MTAEGAALVLKILDLEEKLKDAPQYVFYTNGSRHPLDECRKALDSAKMLFVKEAPVMAMQYVNAALYHWTRWICYKGDLVTDG